MLISLIIPVYNEEKNILKLFTEINQVLSSCNYQYEYIFIDDGSNDSSVNIIRNLPHHKKITLASFSRNFGKEPAIYAGLSLCKGDAAIILDADLQHPIKLINISILIKQFIWRPTHNKQKQYECFGI